jgi:hypothetical protein
MNVRNAAILIVLTLGCIALFARPGRTAANPQQDAHKQFVPTNAANLVAQGRHVFRFETFGDQAFWGDQLHLHQAIEGSKFGGIGVGVSPNTALSVGLKVDVGALPDSLIDELKQGQVNLDDPATTLALLQLNSVVGVTGFFNSNGSLKSVGIQCALCHSTVDNSFAP